MTNEQLAVFIQQGGNDELIPVLWDKVKDLMYSISRRYFNAYKDQCSRSGVELWDLYQIGYTAFVKAVRGFKQDSGYKFNSYLEYPFRNELRDLLGIRTAKRDPLNTCTSLDKPVDSDDADGCSLLDLVSDETSLYFVEDIERDCDAEIVHAVVDTLSEPYKCVIQRYYFKGVSLTAIAAELDITPSRAQQIKSKALIKLRRSRQLRELYREQRNHKYWSRISHLQYSPEHFDMIRHAEKIQSGHIPSETAQNVL